MNLSSEPAVDIRWIVCEDGNENRWRWTEAIRASVDGLRLQDQITVQSVLPDEGLSLAMQYQRSQRYEIVVVWSVTPESFIEQAKRITTLQKMKRNAIQIAATNSIPEKYRTMLYDFGVSFLVQQPEDFQAIVKACSGSRQVFRFSPSQRNF